MAGAARMTDERRWEAVTRRDAETAGAFYYAVTTTGVYCAPGCPSRLPKRENVRFFATTGEAEQAGFRACRRCGAGAPDGPARQAAAIARACRLIEQAESPPALDELAAAAGLSPSHFHRLFRQALGVTPLEYAAARRRARLHAALRAEPTVLRAIFEAGFGSTSRVYEGETRVLGMKPAACRRGGAGEEIRFAIAGSSLGTVLVAATGRGVCAIELGSVAEEVRERLRARFPRARLEEDGGAFREWVAGIAAAVEHPERGLDLPLDIRGTAFQQRVWKALREVPAGTTASYSELARRIGRPGAARAVASACAANAHAVAIPCHRAVRAGGDAGGYRWGAARKAVLLQREAVSAAAGEETAAGEVRLRDVTEADLPLLFAFQADPEANRMAAFGARDPRDRGAFLEHWGRILRDPAVTKKAVLCEGRPAGSVLCFELCGRPAVGYWLGREYWGRGIATRALRLFLAEVRTRPLTARAARDNAASLRVLEKCGFVVVGEQRAYSHARGQEVEEYLLELRG